MNEDNPIDDLEDMSETTLKVLGREFGAQYRSVARWGLLCAIVLLMIGYIVLSVEIFVSADTLMAGLFMALFVLIPLALHGVGLYTFLVPTSSWSLRTLVRLGVCFEGAVLALSGPAIGSAGNAIGSAGNCKSCSIPPILYLTVPAGVLIALMAFFAAPPPRPQDRTEHDYAE